jgi:hypothetical protein
MTEPERISPSLRLQALLSTPERQRTEAEWEEINELEISLTPANREVVQKQGIRRNSDEPGAHPKPSRGPRDRNPFKRLHKGSPKTSTPQ